MHTEHIANSQFSCLFSISNAVSFLKLSFKVYWQSWADKRLFTDEYK